MIELNGCEISKILGKKCKDLEKIKVNKVSTDSRDVDENTVFFALKGDKFDGHDFIADVLEKGCPLVVASHITDDIDKNKVILVRDTLKSLGKLGRYNRMQYKGKVIAITGSAGKQQLKRN